MKIDSSSISGLLPILPKFIHKVVRHEKDYIVVDLMMLHGDGHYFMFGQFTGNMAKFTATFGGNVDTAITYNVGVNTKIGQEIFVAAVKAEEVPSLRKTFNKITKHSADNFVVDIMQLQTDGTYLLVNKFRGNMTQFQTAYANSTTLTQGKLLAENGNVYCTEIN